MRWRVEGWGEGESHNTQTLLGVGGWRGQLQRSMRVTAVVRQLCAWSHRLLRPSITTLRLTLVAQQRLQLLTVLDKPSEREPLT